MKTKKIFMAFAAVMLSFSVMTATAPVKKADKAEPAKKECCEKANKDAKKADCKSECKDATKKACCEAKKAEEKK